jgi:ribosome recycling factor
MLTEERRKDLTKQAKAEGEHAKVGVRNARKDANDEIKKLNTDGLSDDMSKDAEASVQKLTDTYIVKIDVLIERKEKDIMTI